MRFTPGLTAVLALLPTALAVRPHERLRGTKNYLNNAAPVPAPAAEAASAPTPVVAETLASGTSAAAKAFYTPVFKNANTTAFQVAYPLPLINFALQPSWAGRLPVSGSASETRELFFWYWPSSQSTASDTLTIWLNGGPGCSSLDGFLEENGPVSWQPGASGPVANPSAWTTVSDVIYIEQPVGTGFTKGTPNIQNESQLANQFYGFLQQLYFTFPELAAKKLYIAGESYAGFYIPYIANRILTASAAEKAATPVSLQALLINDGVYSSNIVGEQAPIANFTAVNQKALGFSNSQVSSLQSKASSCGYTAMLNQITYPPKGKINLPNGNKDVVPNGCDLFDSWYNTAYDINECFNIYRVTDQCPTPNDPIESYFSRSDVQKALNVPNFGQWSLCSEGNVFSGGNDRSAYSETLFPSLLATLPRGITLWHGLIDGILLSLGDRITIQNLTWGGAQGFQTAPTTPLLLNGVQKGIQHTERNLTYLEVNNAGHMIPEDQMPLGLHVLTALIGKGTL